MSSVLDQLIHRVLFKKKMHLMDSIVENPETGTKKKIKIMLSVHVTH